MCGTFIILFSIRIEVNTKYRDRIYTIDSVPAKKVCLIPGAMVWGDRPSHILEDRLLTGIELYRHGKVEKLILSEAGHILKHAREYSQVFGVNLQMNT